MALFRYPQQGILPFSPWKIKIEGACRVATRKAIDRSETSRRASDPFVQDVYRGEY